MSAAQATAAGEAERDYYARRAESYERIYRKPERKADLRAIEATLPALFAGRRVLEVASGTGWWTAHGARDALSWQATDVNPETLAIARTKPVPAVSVRFALADAYSRAGLGDEPFDAAFTGFCRSHVPRARLPGWLALPHARLQPAARRPMFDNGGVPGSSTPLSRHDADGNSHQPRRPDEGSPHEVLKNFPERDEVVAALGAQAQQPTWTEHPHYSVPQDRLR